MNTVLTETTGDGTECALSPGDVLTRIEDTADANKAVKVLVSSSQKSDCHSGTQVAVQVEDLQDMHNHFREQLDNGLKELASNQGKNGMPAAPDTTTKANPDGQVQPDLTVQQQLQSQESDADKAESEVQQTAAQPADRATTNSRLGLKFERRVVRCCGSEQTRWATWVETAGALGR